MEGDQSLLPLAGIKPAGAPAALASETTPPERLRPASVGVWRKLCIIFRMENLTPSVGLMTLAGCLTLLVAPQDDRGTDPDIAAILNPSLPTIVIDPGHGGKDEGARANGLVEKELTLDLAKRVEDQLQSRGFRTSVTRRDDVYLSLEERTNLANKTNNGIFVSLHFNKAESTTASGIETFFATEKILPEPTWSFAGLFAKPSPQEGGDIGDALAGYVQMALIDRTESTNRGAKAKALYVVRHTTMPAILVEGGFISNPFEAKLISTPAYRDRLAAAVAEGVTTYCKSLPERPKPPTQLAKSTP